VALEQRLLERCRQLSDLEVGFAPHFLHDHQPLFAFAVDAERCARARRNAGCSGKTSRSMSSGAWFFPRAMNQVFRATRHEQFPVVEEPDVAGAQERLRLIAGTSRRRRAPKLASVCSGRRK